MPIENTLSNRQLEIGNRKCSDSQPPCGSPETPFYSQTVESILGLAAFNCKRKQESEHRRFAFCLLPLHPPTAGFLPVTAPSRAVSFLHCLFLWSLFPRRLPRAAVKPDTTPATARHLS